MANDLDSDNDKNQLQQLCHLRNPHHAAAVVERGRALFEFHRLYLALNYDRSRARVRKDSDEVAANFKDVSVNLLSPAFLFPRTVPAGFGYGSQGPTSDLELRLYLSAIAARNEWATYGVLDFRSEDGRSFPYLYLGSGSSALAREHNTKGTKLRVWIQAAVHGNEPAGDQSVLALIGRMDAQAAWTASLLAEMDIFLLPRYNPDGVAHFQRTLVTNIDLNRDHLKMASQQTRDIKKIFSNFAPHLAIDMHECSAVAQYADNYQHGSDGLYAAAKNLNINHSIRSMSEELFAPAVARDFEAVGLRCEPYVTGTPGGSTLTFNEAGTDAKIGRNAMGLTQCITFLTEARGIGIANQEFQRRTAASLTMVESIIQTAANNAESVYNTVEDAIIQFTNSTEDIIITDSATSINRTFTLVNSKTGRVEKIPITLRSTTPTTANLTRARPEAYLIPSTQVDLATHLVDLGLEVETLPHRYQGSVQAYHITSAKFEDTYYEGIVPVTATVKIVTRKIDLDPGAFWVSTRQKNAALAFVAIEPENVDSWVSCNVLSVSRDCQLPVFRVMQQQQQQ